MSKRARPEKPEKKVEESPSTRPFWSGTITFGLVSIPVALFPANRSSHLGLRTLSPEGTPLRRRYVSASTGKELDPEALARGHETEKGSYVLISDDELEKLAPEKSRDIDLRKFVALDQIHPIYFERGYFLAPAGESSKAYRLLATVLEKTRRAGVATFVMRGKEYLVSIVSENGILRAETMRFKEEVRSPADVGLPEKSTVPAVAKRRMERIIHQRSANELPRTELHDQTSAALLKLVKSKEAHRENVVINHEGEGESEDAAPPDLLAALKKSLAGHHGRRVKSARTLSARPPHHAIARQARAARRAADR